MEECDNWLRNGQPLGDRPARASSTGADSTAAAKPSTDDDGQLRYRWVDTDNVMAMACDILIPGYGNDTVNNMRLWAAEVKPRLQPRFFNTGDYIKAVEDKVLTENISKVLYPSDEAGAGRSCASSSSTSSWPPPSRTSCAASRSTHRL